LPQIVIKSWTLAAPRWPLKGLKMKKQRRWMKSVLAAAAEPQVVMPWARQARRRPKSLDRQAVAGSARVAAR
jgi:hypothetical protein